MYLDLPVGKLYDIVVTSVCPILTRCAVLVMLVRFNMFVMRCVKFMFARGVYTAVSFRRSGDNNNGVRVTCVAAGADSRMAM